MRKKRRRLSYIKKHWMLYAMLLPGFVYLIVFKYIPLGGLVIAFQNYNPFLGLTESPFVGLKHFIFLFSGSDFKKLMVNTLWISVLNLIFYFPMPIITALLLNEIRNYRFKSIVQTMIYIPHFISFVIVASITYVLCNEDTGFINMVTEKLIGHTLPFLSGTEYFRPIIIIQNIWKETGWGMIVFLAALAGVDVHLYEAAKVDGAGRWRQMWYITLPEIKGTIVIMLILRVGSLLNTGYEQIYLMSNALNRSVAEVFDTYVYRIGISNGQYSFATAVGIFKGVVGCVMVLSTNLPFLYIFGGSFATERELYERPFLIIPRTFSLNAYKFIIDDGRIIQGLKNSVLVTFLGTAVAMGLSSTFAYPLSRKDFVGRTAVLNMVIVTMVFSGGIIPNYLLVKSLNLIDSYGALILPGAMSAFNMVIIKNFFEGMPKELTEAAVIDGCSDFSIFIRIIVPLSKPVLASISLFYAVSYWNDYFNCMLYINDTAKQTAQLILRSIVLLAQGFDLSGSPIDFGTNGKPPSQAVKLATTIVTVVPILIVYPFVQKFFTKGVMIGAVKG
ncbi:MAG: ABC transporter permease subunit [Lachnospiraceae bacterium]|nr:ABC transporter permease subunit [Lachnospiraceae bacterium]